MQLVPVLEGSLLRSAAVRVPSSRAMCVLQDCKLPLLHRTCQCLKDSNFSRSFLPQCYPVCCRFEVTDWTSGSGRQPLDLGVYAVTDPKCNQQWQRSNAAAVELAVAGGVTLVQLREKLADGGDYVQQAREVIAVARPLGVRGSGPCMQTNAVTPHLGLQTDVLHEQAQHARPCLRLQAFCLGQQLARGFKAMVQP